MGEVPHWYLWTMAVMTQDPSAEECDKALMHCVLDVADNDIARFPCYKEATSAEDVTFLKATYGFEVVEYHEGGTTCHLRAACVLPACWPAACCLLVCQPACLAACLHGSLAGWLAVCCVGKSAGVNFVADLQLALLSHRPDVRVPPDAPRLTELGLGGGGTTGGGGRRGGLGRRGGGNGAYRRRSRKHGNS